MEKSKSFKPRIDEIEDWQNRAKEALDLAQIELESGYYWGVVGRSYYAAFYIVKALLLSHGEIAKTHKGTLSRFFEFFVKTNQISRDLGRWFSQAMESRNEADYDIREDWTEEKAEEILENAREFVEAVDKLIKTDKK